MQHNKSTKLNGKTITIDIFSDADESVFNEIFTDKEYRPLDEAITKAKLILDLGAHKGMFSIYAATLNPNAKIMAYEPDNDNFAALKTNLKKNHINNVSPKNLAIADKEGAGTLYIHEDSHNHSITQESGTEQHTQFTTLSKIIERATPDILKIDIEGAEYQVLLSTPPDLLAKIPNIYLEYHDYDHSNSELIAHLQKSGHKVKATPSHYDKKMGTIHAKR